jgi:uncharacterized protein
MDRVFVDTGALIPLVVTTDSHHSDARRTYNALIRRGARMLTTNHVVDETCTFILRHARDGHGLAVRFGQRIAELPVWQESCDVAAAASGLTVLYSTPVIESVAWDIFAKYDTAGFSFTDCVSFAVMQMLGIRKAFAFDVHYDVMGFERV